MTKEYLTSPALPTPIGVYCQALRVPATGHFIYVSGLTSRDSTGAVVGVGDIRAQTRQVLENLKSILSEGGATLDDVLKVIVYIRHMADFDAIHEIRRQYWPENPPASTMVEVSRLVDERSLIEIEAVARTND